MSDKNTTAESGLSHAAIDALAAAQRKEEELAAARRDAARYRRALSDIVSLIEADEDAAPNEARMVHRRGAGLMAEQLRAAWQSAADVLGLRR